MVNDIRFSKFGHAIILTPLSLAIAAFSCSASAAAPANISQIEEQIMEMRHRLEALEAQLKQLKEPPVEEVSETIEEVSATITDQAPILSEISSRQLMAAEGRSDPYLDDDFTKSVPLFGSPWRFSFGGYAKVDMIYDFSGSGNKQQFVLGQIPVGDNQSEGNYSHMQVSETRFHFEMQNSESTYDNSLFLEFDFFDESNKSSTRLRHAYVRYGKLLAGQTWTLLSELRQLPMILDFAAGDSILGGRTEQLRWTEHSKDKSLGWAVALENFNDSAIYNPTGLSGAARSEYPRLSTGVTKLWDWVEWSNGLSITQLRFDGTEDVGDEQELGLTATTAGRVYLDESKRNWFGFGFGYQRGSINDVITFANAGIPNAAIDANGELDLAKGWNTQLGLHLAWNQKLSSNISFAYAKMTDVPALFDPDWIRRGSAIHANLIYKFDQQLSAGAEFMYGERENVSGEDGDAQRVQFSTFYYF